MKLAVDIVISLIVLFWPALVMISPMIFDAPGSEYSRAKIIFLLCVFFYPAVIFIVYMLFDIKYFAITPKIPFLIASIISIGVFVFFGHPKLIIDGWRGVSG